MKNIDYHALEDKMKHEHEFLHNEIYVFNSYNCEEGEMRDRVVVDIGANTGYFAIYAVMNGAKKVYAYEPDPKNFVRLIERTKDFDNIIAINKAVHKPGVKKCITINEDVRAEVRVVGETENGIECVSLKDILDGIEERVVLKTDCEGSEYDFFLFSDRETLQKIDLIYSEFHNNLHPNPEYNVDMLTNFIVDNGFENIKCINRWITGTWMPDGSFIPNTELGENGSENCYRKFRRMDNGSAQTLLDKLKREDALIYKEIFEENFYMAEDSELRGGTVVDIGANKGYFSIYAALRGAKVVYAYEPNKETYAKLLENIQMSGLTNIVPINKGVHRADTKRLYSVGKDGTSAVVPGDGPDSVDSVSIGEIASGIDGDILLKIDCEGSEYDILLPCDGKLLSRFKTIYAEFHGPRKEELNAHLESNGFAQTKANCRMSLYVYGADNTCVETPIDVETSKFLRTKARDYSVYDCFPFFNELELLEIRLEELYDVVDKFVITESNTTHSGNPKPLYLTENFRRFERYKDKIVLRVIDLSKDIPSSPMGPNWMREHMQRNDGMKYLKSVCGERDVVIVSDVDEIPSVRAINEYLADDRESVGVLVQDRFMYCLNYKNMTTDEPQLNSKIVRFGTLGKYDLYEMNAIRYADTERLMPTFKIENGGWHFTFMGGIEKVIEKVKAFAHQEYNVPGKIDYDRMFKIFNEGRDVYDAKTTWSFVEVDGVFPKKVQREKQRYIDMGWINADKTKYDNNRNDKEILCSISTRGRYDTTLAMAIQSVICQTLKPNALVVFDDNDEPKDLRDIQHYNYLFRMLDEKGISWQIIFGQKKGQHFNHQLANTMGYKWVWRLDDDCVAEPDVLEKLYSRTDDTVGAVGGSVLTPPACGIVNATGKMENIKTEPNIQWGHIDADMEVDHLHCSFLYRANVANYDLSLSKVAHREESLFTYAIKRAGYRVIVTPCVTWHLKNETGGIRSHDNQELYVHDERIFDAMLNLWDVRTDSKLIVLDNGIGDHYAFKNILPRLRAKYSNITIACCFPEVFHDEPGLRLISIAEAKQMMSIDAYNIYRFMFDENWDTELTHAFEKLYL